MGGASVRRVRSIQQRGPSVQDKIAAGAAMFLSGPKPTFTSLGALLGKQAFKGVKDNVSNVLKANGCTKTFLRNCQKPVTNSNALDEREPATGFAVIPYIQGVTEPIKRILNSHNMKVAQKPFQTLGHIFAKPKDPVTKEQ